MVFKLLPNPFEQSISIQTTFCLFMSLQTALPIVYNLTHALSNYSVYNQTCALSNYLVYNQTRTLTNYSVYNQTRALSNYSVLSQVLWTVSKWE